MKFVSDIYHLGVQVNKTFYIIGAKTMNVKTYAKNIVAKMNTVKNVIDAKALVALIVKECQGDIQVLNLVLAEVSDLVDGQDAVVLEQMFKQEVPAVCAFNGKEISSALWFNDKEYIMGTELVVPTSADKRAEFNINWEASLAELDEVHARNTKDMMERHQAAVTAMRARFN